MTAVAVRSPRWFVPTAVVLAGICVALVRSQVFRLNPDLAAWGVTFDLTLTVPLIYYLFIVRPGHARPLTIAPLFVAGVTVAALVIPRNYQQFVHQLRFVSAPLEIVTIFLVLQRLARMRRSDSSDSDTWSRVHAATRHILGDTRVATFVSMELTIVYYGLFAWRTPAPHDPRQITVMEKSGWGSIVACIVVLLLGESAGLHFLMLHWFGAVGAWCVTALDVYTILWLFGDYHALRLRPSFVADGVLHVRHGLRWTLDVPLSNVRSIAPVQGEADWKRKGVLKLALFDEPRFLVQLQEPMTAAGIAGIRKSVDAIAIRPDEEERFLTLLT
jgi:hypothetical protein